MRIEKDENIKCILVDYRVVKPLSCVTYLKYLLVCVTPVLTWIIFRASVWALVVWKVAWQIILYGTITHNPGFEWQDKWHDHPHLMTRNQPLWHYESIKVPVLVDGEITNSKSRIVLMSGEGNFKESKGHWPQGVCYQMIFLEKCKEMCQEYLLGIYIMVQNVLMVQTNCRGLAGMIRVKWFMIHCDRQERESKFEGTFWRFGSFCMGLTFPFMF